MSNTYSVTINIPAATLAKLAANSYSLYAFKVVKGPKGSVPVVWFSTQTFEEQTIVSWTEQYNAYTSQSQQLNPNTHIVATASCGVDLGDLVTVAAGGIPTVQEGPDPLGVSILNNTTTDFVCGLSQQQGTSSTYNPVCAFPLIGSMQDEIIPIEQVFLMFATQEVDTGTVLEMSISWGALIDLTSNNQMIATYDLTQLGGWIQAPDVTPYQPDTSLVPLLIPGSAKSGSLVAAGR
jgi:hypothetical protein